MTIRKARQGKRNTKTNQTETYYFDIEKCKNCSFKEGCYKELKHRHGYDVASSSGLIGMEMQGAVTIFAVNMKRIIKLLG